MADEKPQLDTPESSGPSQTTRRTKYGINVAVAVVAATLIVILLNVIVDRGYRRLPAGAKGFLRYDLTATRQYSLSPQTLKILGELQDQYIIVNVSPEEVPSVEAQRVQDLLEEYDYYSNKITVEQINPGYYPTQADKLYSQILARYESELEPVVGAIKQGRQALRNVVADTAGIVAPVAQVTNDPALAAGPLKQVADYVFSSLRRLEEDLGKIDTQLDRELSQSLPNYEAAKSTVVGILTQLDGSLFTIATEEFKKATRQDATPPSIKNQLLIAVGQLEQISSNIAIALDALQQVEAVDSYEQVRMAVKSTETVVVLGPDQVRVVVLQNMFREIDPEVLQRSGRPNRGFLGEERLNGALLSMSMEHQPLVVFVSMGPGSPIGPRGTHEHVAQRLRVSNFEVTQWNPAGRPGPYGQPMPPSPAPTPKAGQKAVWIVLPAPPPDPRNPMAAMAGGAAQQVADMVTQRLADGDAVMINIGLNPTAQFGQSDPMAQLIDTWGISALQDRIILRQIQTPDRRTVAMSQFEVSHWPQDWVLTKSLGGKRAIFLQPSPLVVGNIDAITYHALVTLTDDKMWALSDLFSAQQVQDPKFDEAESQPTFVVGVAAEKDEQRLIAMAAPGWDCYYITPYGPIPPNSAEMFRAMLSYPGNAELFVNSVFWLADMDQLIAATPRSQDIRRIAMMSSAGLIAWRWLLLLGLPLVILIAGMGVWMVRRRD